MDAHTRKVYVPMTETGFYILLCLREPNHGYGIVQKVKELIAETELPLLKEYMKQEELTDAFIEESIDNTCNFTNARDITVKAARMIFENALTGI